MTAITELAPAKINLTLKVRGRRPDGYHEIDGLIAFAADVGDLVHLEPGTSAGLRVSGPFAAAIKGRNLIETALERLAEAEPRLVLGSIALEKRLPVAAGLGGGSADAAALLRLVRRANPALADAVAWTALAVSLGADVPVCLESRPAFARGMGERVEPLPDLPRIHLVLVNPLARVPSDKTARVFAQLDAANAAAGPASPVSPSGFADAEALLAFMRAQGNDLTAAATATVPEIAQVRAALSEAPQCRLAALSGAGPTCFGIFASAEVAAMAEAALRESRPEWWVVGAALGG
jgi:4-diphosphocytidyl-2-C-methyl-D-erythritol kinase